MGSISLIRLRLFPSLLLLFLVGTLAEKEAQETVSTDAPKPSFVAPKIPDGAYLALYFTSASDLHQQLTTSQAKKDGADEAIAKYDGIWSVEVPQTSAIDGDFALILKSKAKHHAIASKLKKPIKFDTNELVIQYEVKFEEGMECGGAYIKLLSASNLDLKNFNDKTPYTIMFGPDKCGLDHKFHFIFRHKNPKTGEFEEKHAKKIKQDIERHFTDKKTHLYTLVLRSDNTFERYIDQVKVQSGNLLEDFEPPVNPPKEVDDPNDTKPNDWDEREKIVDETATKPDDWDENAPEFIADESATKPSGWLDDELEMIPDPNAKIPEDWDSKIDGDWEPPKIKNPKCESAPGCGEWTRPLIRNPNYKGKWSPPLIPNPSYKGIWKPRKIPNPNYFEDSNPYRNLVEVNAIGLELWSMTDRIVFDNFLIVDSKHAADAFASETWVVKEKAERMADPKAQSVVDAIKETYAEKPWLVFVIGLVCTLPILLCCVYFCRSPRDEVSIRKKTDVRVPDDHSKAEEKNTDDEDDDEREDIDEGPTQTGVADASGDDESESDKNIPVKESPKGDVADSSSTPLDSEPVDKQSVRKRRSRKE